MSTNVNANVLINFIKRTVGADKITQNQAQRYGVDVNQYQAANENDNNFLELDEILNDKDLYEQFATMYVEEQQNDKDVANEEREKEEALKVQSKGEQKA